MSDNDTTEDAAGWVDKLFESARESAKATTDGLTEMAGGVAEVGQSVAMMADAVTKLADAVHRTRGHATDTKHAVTAADWFWRQCKAVLVGHKKAVAGAMACLYFATGTPTTIQAWHEVRPIGRNAEVERMLADGRLADAERVVAERWREIGERDGYWFLARVRQLQGDAGAAMVLARVAADHGHPDAQRLTGTKL